mgnify:CR=1 FL=1
MKASWKTTAAGLAAIILVIAQQFFPEHAGTIATVIVITVAQMAAG